MKGLGRFKPGDLNDANAWYRDSHEPPVPESEHNAAMRSERETEAEREDRIRQEMRIGA